VPGESSLQTSASKAYWWPWRQVLADLKVMRQTAYGELVGTGAASEQTSLPSQAYWTQWPEYSGLTELSQFRHRCNKAALGPDSDHQRLKQNA
jgi:hypothetical protein